MVNYDFFIPLAFDAPVRDPHHNVAVPLSGKKLQLHNGNLTVICLAVPIECLRVTDRQTDGQSDRQTSCDGIICVMHNIAR